VRFFNKPAGVRASLFVKKDFFCSKTLGPPISPPPPPPPPPPHPKIFLRPPNCPLLPENMATAFPRAYFSLALPPPQGVVRTPRLSDYSPTNYTVSLICLIWIFPPPPPSPKRGFSPHSPPSSLCPPLCNVWSRRHPHQTPPTLIVSVPPAFSTSATTPARPRSFPIAVHSPPTSTSPPWRFFRHPFEIFLTSNNRLFLGYL